MNSRSTFVSVALIATILVLNRCTLAAQTANQSQATAQLHQQPITVEAGVSADAAAASSGGVGAAASVAKESVLTRGTTLLAEFSGALNAKKLKAGDRVKATLTQDLVVGGKLIAKTESKLIGHVTEATAHSAENPESRLGIVFDKILLKHHEELDFKGAVQALAPPAPRPSRVDMPDQMMPPIMGVSSSTPNLRRGSGSSSASSSRSRGSTSLANSAPLGQVAAVGSTPGMTPASGTLHPAATNNHQLSGGIGIHGIYGLKGLSLSPATSPDHPGPVIVSENSDVKLENGTQVVLLVVAK